MSNYPQITFVIPIYNSGAFLPDCFRSIRKQNYPKTKIEIICPDGGSRDNSAEIAKEYGANVIKNPKRLAEPGFMLGAQKAKGELIVYMGADNRLVEKDWLRRMVKPFENEKIMGAYPWLRSRKENTWLTKYFNAFTDPVNHFILGSSCNPLYFHKVYAVLEESKDYIVYDFSLDEFPLLAFDQGFMCRKSYKRPIDTEYDDILPVLNMVEKKMSLAFVPSASNYHETLEKGLSQYSRKMRWIIDSNLFEKATFGLPTRQKKLNKVRRLRFYLWPVYTFSIIGPLVYSLWGLLTDRKREWIYHFPITLYTLYLLIFELVRVGLLRQKSLASRQ